MQAALVKGGQAGSDFETERLLRESATLALSSHNPQVGPTRPTPYPIFTLISIQFFSPCFCICTRRQLSA